MKKIVITLLSMLLPLGLLAQNEGDCNPVKYALPQFIDGVAQIDDGSRQGGKFNICLVDQCIHFIQGADTLTLGDNNSVEKVTIGRHIFYRERMKYTEILDMAGDVFLGLEKNTVVTDNFKQGAYGTVSATSSIDSYTRNDVTGMYYDTVLDDPKNYIYEETYMLIKGSKFYILNKKSLLKCFPQKKDIIEAYASEHNSNFTRSEDVLEIFNLLK